MKDSELRIVSLISGGGTTFARIADETQNGSLLGKVNIIAVLADRFGTPGIKIAKDKGIRTVVIDKRTYTSVEAFGKDIIAICEDADVILQNGWLSHTPENVIDKYQGRIFNQHPAPLDPDNKDENGIPLHFGGKGMHGLAAHAAVLKFQELAGRRFPTEATIHHVTKMYDSGQVVARYEVEVCQGDTSETLAKRVLPVEHEAQIIFLSDLYDGKVKTIKRTENLIKKDEENFLYKAKEYADQKYNKRQ